jgi:hypothetical protein
VSEFGDLTVQAEVSERGEQQHQRVTGSKINLSRGPDTAIDVKEVTDGDRWSDSRHRAASGHHLD